MTCNNPAEFGLYSAERFKGVLDAVREEWVEGTTVSAKALETACGVWLGTGQGLCWGEVCLRNAGPGVCAGDLG